MLGYSPEEVVGFLDHVAKTIEKVQKKEKELLSHVEKLNSQLKQWESKESEVKKVQQAAISEAERIISEAEARAQEVRNNTEQWLSTVLQEVEALERRKADFITAFRSALDSHYEILKTEEAGIEPIGTKLTKYLSDPEKNLSSGLLS